MLIPEDIESHCVEAQVHQVTTGALTQVQARCLDSSCIVFLVSGCIIEIYSTQEPLDLWNKGHYGRKGQVEASGTFSSYQSINWYRSGRITEICALIKT